MKDKLPKVLYLPAAARSQQTNFTICFSKDECHCIIPGGRSRGKQRALLAYVKL